MKTKNISVSESSPHPEVSVVNVGGVIDTLSSPELEKIITSLLKRKCYKIILDLTRVEYISTGGWSSLVSCVKRIRENKGALKLANMVPNVYESYKHLEFDSIIDARESIDLALTSFGIAEAANSKNEIGLDRSDPD